MAEDRDVDAHLVAVANEVLDAVYQAKQAAWAASTVPTRETLQELVTYLIEQSGLFMVAEERIGGRSSDITTPSSHQRGNLVAEADGDHRKAVALLAQRLAAVAADARDRAADIPDADEASMLLDLADGLELRAGRLEHE